MKAHIDAIRTLLTAAGIASHYIDVPEKPALPYVLISPGLGAPHPDVPLCGTASSLVLDILLTAVAGTPGGADTVAGKAKSALFVGDRRTPLTVTGRSASIRWERTETAGVDRQVTIPDTNRHPAFRKDTYRVDSTPA